MENSTKALLIIAGILISIVLISISIILLNSSSNISNSSQQLGKEISVTSDKASKDLISKLEDINNKNLINVKNQTIKVQNDYYNQYKQTYTNYILEPNTKYILSFDYKILSTDADVLCGIGYGKKNKYLDDLIDNKSNTLWGIKYPVQAIGQKATFIKEFTTPNTFSVNTPYLSIRFVRFYAPSNGEVEISNVKFKKIEK